MMRNRLAEILGCVVCWLRGRHEWGAKFPGWAVGELKVWYQECSVCHCVKTTSQPVRRKSKNEHTGALDTGKEA